MCGGLGASSANLPFNPALQSSPQVTSTQQAVRDSSFIRQDHSTYSKDLTYSNYYLFLNFKNFFCGIRYPNNEWLTSVIEAWLEKQI